MRSFRLALGAAMMGLVAVPAFANVTIYGKLDLGLVKANKAADESSMLAGAPGGKQAVLNEGAGSRLGFKGSEDLGGGLSAKFQFEHRFKPDTGAQSSSTFWQGRSWLGMAGGFGEVRLGRDWAPAFYPANDGDPWGWDTVGQMGSEHTWALYDTTGPGNIRHRDMITYLTPDLNGFAAQVAVSLKEDKAPRNTIGMNATYTSGPLYVGFGYDRVDSDNLLYVLTGRYTMGPFTPIVSFAKSKIDGSGVKNITLGLDAAVGAGRVLVGLAHLNPDGDNNNTTKLGVGYHHPLSKRTKVYVDLGSAKTQTLPRRTGIDLGLQHNF